MNGHGLAQSLFLMRVGVFIVMAVWTVDKFINPDHAARVFDRFYHIDGLADWTITAIGAVQGAIVLAFLAGFKKRLSYGLVFLMHAASTVSSYEKYMHPFDAGNILFFAAIPMLAACYALYTLRDQDTLFTLAR